MSLLKTFVGTGCGRNLQRSMLPRSVVWLNASVLAGVQLFATEHLSTFRFATRCHCGRSWTSVLDSALVASVGDFMVELGIERISDATEPHIA